MIAIDWNPDRKTLRTFAVGLVVLAVAYASWLGWNARLSIGAIWVCGVTGGLGLVGMCVPSRLRWVYVVWMVVVFPIGWSVFQAMLAILYFVVIMPLGLLMKALGRDPLQLRAEPNAITYWNERPQSDDPRRHFRQY